MTTAGRSVIEKQVSTKAAAPTTSALPAPRLRRAHVRMSGAYLAKVAAACRAEVAAQAQRWSLWAPVAFGSGGAGYFALKVEPSAVWPAALALVVIGAAIAALAWGRSQALAIGLVLVAFAGAGFADGKLATELARAPVVPGDIGVVRLEGWVVDVASPSKGRPRVLLAPTHVAGLAEADLPARVRLTLQGGDPPPPGAAIHATAILNPPPGPASPGSYDFARDAWFDRVGGVGLALVPPREVELHPPPLPLRLEMGLNAFRWRLAQRLADDLQAVVGGAGAGLAATVATSHENWLDPSDADDLRNSGLAHMLAIAGLHTAAVTGFVFAAIRLAVAAWPWLALRVSGKKLAAAGGLVAAVCYLAISGAHPPARRAAITAGVAFLAILLDRRPISLRSLAIAALVILALQPVAIVEPGFQMSFCATAALVAMAEVWPRRGGRIEAPWFIAWPQHAKDWAVALFMVSLVAGAATAPFAIQHFNRVASYGLPANLFADFIASALLMPALVISVIGETLGAGPLVLSPVLAVAGWSGQAILAIAHTFATAPGASQAISSAPWPALPLAFIGIIAACLWKGRLRWVFAPLGLAVLIWPRPPPPVGWIAADGDNAAITVDGRAVVLKPKVRQFASEAWAQRRGLILPFDPEAEAALAFDCDRSHCTPHEDVTPALGAWWSKRPPAPAALEALCQASDIVVIRAEVETPTACSRTLVLGPDALARGGAGEIFDVPAGGWVIRWSQHVRGDRPWSVAAWTGAAKAAPRSASRTLTGATIASPGDRPTQ
ncbi:MAG: ComEC/Rec2 family competence protein [Caulobacteraceae bacterium]